MLNRELRYKTRRLRFLMIKLLSPTIYKRSFQYLGSRTRPMTSFLKKRFGKKSLIGVEIGVYYGGNAKNMIEVLNLKRLYLVDPYEVYVKSDGQTFDSRYALAKALENLKKYRQQTKFICLKSSEAIKHIHNKVDFVYIDGNHCYNFVKKDIEVYYPIIKKGGVLGGHDFRNINVIKAVMEFVVKNNMRIFAKEHDWWVIKKG